MSRRSLIFFASFALAGAALGAGLWLAFGASGHPDLDRIEADLAWRAPAQPVSSAGEYARAIVAKPPITPVPAQAPVAEPSVSLAGVARAGRRGSALLIIDGKSEWMAAGDRREGLALLQVGASSAEIETVSGKRTLTIGPGTATQTQAQSPGPSLSPTAAPSAQASPMQGPVFLPPPRLPSMGGP